VLESNSAGTNADQPDVGGLGSGRVYWLEVATRVLEGVGDPPWHPAPRRKTQAVAMRQASGLEEKAARALGKSVKTME
jgi:hypothetical protein